MSEKSEQEKREAIAGELADLRLRQTALCRLGPELERRLPASCRAAWREVVENDERDARLIETATVSFGVRAEPSEATRRLVELAYAGEGEILERLFLYAVLKHEQLLGSRLVARATQLSPRDVKEALSFLIGVQDSVEHKEAELLEIVQEVGLFTLLGEEPASGLVDRVRGAAASVADAVRSAIARPPEPPDVDALLRLDHRRILVLFDEIEAARGGRRGRDLFRQFAADLRAHMEAEERAIYDPFESHEELRDELEEHRIEHDGMRDSLNALEQMTPGDEYFTPRLRELRRVVRDHIDGEEDRVLPRIWRIAGAQEKAQMVADFRRIKEEIQERPGAAVYTSAPARASAPRLGFGFVKPTARPAAPMGGP
jgi:hemerythrin superfamily protein